MIEDKDIASYIDGFGSCFKYRKLPKEWDKLLMRTNKRKEKKSLRIEWKRMGSRIAADIILDSALSRIIAGDYKMSKSEEISFHKNYYPNIPSKKKILSKRHRNK